MAARGMGEVALQVLTPYRLDSLCIGAYLAVGSRSDQPGEKASLLPFARWARPLLYGTFTLTVLLSFWHQRTLLFDAFTLPLRRTVIDFFFAALLVRVLTLDEGTVLVRFFSSAAMRMLGRYSYGLYVFHGIIAYGLVEVQADASWLTARLGSHVLAMFVQGLLGGLVSLAVAVASYELFEKRFLRLKERFASRAEKPAKLTREHLRDPEIERQEVDNVTR
jgi:peptidoglycan/LPS O-acetylase OafA/YrhL